MTGLAAVAINHGVVASLGTTFLPGVAPSAVAGFGAGALLSALCVLGVMAQRRHSRWQRRAGRTAAPRTGPRQPRARENPGNVATIAEVGALAYAPAGYGPTPSTFGAEPRSEVRRSAGRHAAPPASASSRMASKRASRLEATK
jgi:hypothetical protein